MTRIPVSSSDVAAIGYEPETMLMEVEFVTGAIYLYYDVPQDFYAAFMEAPSKGEFVNRILKRSGLAYEKILD